MQPAADRAAGFADTLPLQPVDGKLSAKNRTEHGIRGAELIFTWLTGALRGNQFVAQSNKVVDRFREAPARLAIILVRQALQNVQCSTRTASYILRRNSHVTTTLRRAPAQRK